MPLMALAPYGPQEVLIASFSSMRLLILKNCLEMQMVKDSTLILMVLIILCSITIVMTMRVGLY
ncbi:hypothetical protein D3C85_1725790 [compost metagenome]